jgi:aspartate/methionine/tyrosine aminotransferase
MGRVMPSMSTSWKASVPMKSVATWPVMATSGAESIIALAMPVTRLVAPGPEVAMQTPGLPVTRPQASAANAAPCSCRTRIWRSFEPAMAS